METLKISSPTKYNIGQEVWHRSAGQNMKTTIRKIKIDYKGTPTYYCDFFLSVIAFREEALFPSEEELIKSL